MRTKLPKQYITLICEHCKTSFEKPLKEYTRQLKHNPDYKFYCCRSCTGKAVTVNNIKDHYGKYNKNLHTKQKDEFSKFREYLRRSRRRLKVIDITLEDLKIQ